MSVEAIAYFYTTRAWRKTRRAYIADRGGLCERCLSRGLITPGEEVHHKIKLTPGNLSDPSISLDWNNLELLCKNCHMQEHQGHTPTRWFVDEHGRVEIAPPIEEESMEG